MKRAISALLLAFLCAASVVGQEEPESVEAEQVRVYYVPTQPLTDDADTLELVSIINRALVRAVERLDLTPVMGDTIEPLAAARDVGALLLIESSATVERRELAMSFRAIEASTARVIAADFVPTLVGVSVHNRIREVVEDIAGRLEEFLANPGEVEAFDPFVLSAEVLMGPDGTVISLPSGQELAVVNDGSAQLPFDPYPVGTNIVLRREHPGYHTEESPVTFGSANATLELRSLWKETRWAVDAHSALGQAAGLGLGGRYFINPDTWFVGAQNYFYVQPSQIPNAGDIYHNDIGLWTGRYFFFPYDSPFRLGLGAGLGTILTRIDRTDLPLFNDSYLMPLSFWAEYNLRKWTFFLKSDLKLALGIGNNLLGSGIIGVRNLDDGTASELPLAIGVGRKL